MSLFKTHRKNPPAKKPTAKSHPPFPFTRKKSTCHFDFTRKQKAASPCSNVHSPAYLKPCFDRSLTRLFPYFRAPCLLQHFYFFASMNIRYFHPFFISKCFFCIFLTMCDILISVCKIIVPLSIYVFFCVFLCFYFHILMSFKDMIIR